MKTKEFKFTATDRKGNKRFFEEYDQVCEFLDKTFPEKAIAGFIIHDWKDNPLPEVTHS